MGSPAVREVLSLEGFINFLYGAHEGFVYAPTKSANDGRWTEFYFKLPLQREELLAHIRTQHSTGDVYIAPALFKSRSASKIAVKGSQVLWTEYDGNAPTSKPHDKVVPPNLRVQSSGSGHEHHYWFLDSFITDIPRLERINRGIAYTTSADSSGWDANQVLRPPETFNHKRQLPVEIKQFNKGISYSLDDFTSLTEIKQVTPESIDVTAIPDPLDVVAKYPFKESDWRYFHQKEIEHGKRSSALTAVAHSCAEMGMRDEEIFSLLLNADSRWKKFHNRPDRTKRLLELINYVRQKHGYEPTTEPVSRLPRPKPISIIKLAQDLPAIEWVIEGFLQRAGLVMLAGPPASGKTQLTMRMQNAISLGQEFLGFRPVEQLRTIFFSHEMSEVELGVFRNLMVPDYSAEDQLVLEQNSLYVPIGEGINFSSTEGQEWLERYIVDENPIGIFIDSLGLVIPGALTDEVELKKVFSFFEHLRNTYGCFIWIISHMRKSNSDNTAPDTLDDIYGSQVIGQRLTAALTMFPMNRLKHSEDSLEIILRVVKSRLGAMHTAINIMRTATLNYTITRQASSRDSTQSDSFDSRFE